MLSEKKQAAIKEFERAVVEDYNIPITAFVKLNEWTYRYTLLEVDLYPTKYQAYYYKHKTYENISETLDKISRLLRGSAVVTQIPTDKPIPTTYLHLNEDLKSEKYYKVVNSITSWKRLLDAIAFVHYNNSKESTSLLLSITKEVLKDLPKELFSAYKLPSTEKSEDEE